MKKSLSRKKDARNSLLRNLATSLVLYEEIKTTQAKAQAVKPVIEHLISVSKKAEKGNTLAVRRRLLGYFFDTSATKKMFEVLVPRYQKVNSGFVQSFRVGQRLGDNASMVILRLVRTKEEKIEQEVSGEENAPKDLKKAEKPASGKKPAGKKASK